MKKLFPFLLLAVMAFAYTPTHAQIPKAVAPSKTSLSAADTASAVIPIDGTVQSVQIGATKTSGTVAGKIYWQGLTLDGATWVKLDSMTVANSAGLQYKLITMGTAPFIYLSYRFYYLSTGGVWVPSGYYLKRNL